MGVLFYSQNEFHCSAKVDCNSINNIKILAWRGISRQVCISCCERIGSCVDDSVRWLISILERFVKEKFTGIVLMCEKVGFIPQQ